MTAAPGPELVLPPSQIEELIRTVGKAQRAFQMYLPNNPIYHRAIDNLRAAFAPVWSATDEITLVVAETDFVWEDTVVYHQMHKPESLAWAMYKDGLRTLTLRRGVEEHEIIQFLQVLNRVKILPADAADDLLTLLWEQDFQLVQYHFAEFLADASVPGPEHGEAAPPPPESVRSEVRQESDAARQEQAARPKGVVDLEEFDSTLYFLDEAEVAYLAEQVEREYSRDLRVSAMNAMFDIFEGQDDAEVRDEILDAVEGLFPGMLNAGDFRTGASVLREARALSARVAGLTEVQANRLRVFDQLLSEPGIVSQLMQSLDEAATRPSDDDVRELLREFRPPALETLVIWFPKLSSSQVRTLVEQVIERLALAHTPEVLRLLREQDSEALPGVVALCGRLNLEGSVPGLIDVLGHSVPALRHAGVDALAQIGSAGALAGLDRAIGDEDRGVRLAAVKTLGARGYKGALKRVEDVVLGKGRRDLDFNERRAFFEAYGVMAGPASIVPLRDLLEARGLFRRKQSPEVRMCAALGLGKVGTPEARAVLEAAANDKDRQVRNAVTAALRGASA
jgi:hypothetical protein